MPLNQHVSRQPSTSFWGAPRWLSARSAGGYGPGFFEGADCFPSSHPIFFFESAEKKGKEKRARMEYYNAELQKPKNIKGTIRRASSGSLSLAPLYSLLASYSK